MITIQKVSHHHLRKRVREKIQSCGYRIDDKNAVWFVAKVDGVYAGFAGFYKLTPPIGYLGPTYVEEQFRGMGVQQKLINHRLEFAKSHGIETVWSRTDFDNIASARNLIRCGFNLTRPKVCGIVEGGNLSVTLDGNEMLSTSPTDLFFIQEF